MLNFEEEILHHASGYRRSSVAQKAEHDEVAVPAVHLVKTAAGNNVRVLQKKQARRVDRAGVNFSGAVDHKWQMLHVHFAVGLQLLH